MGLFLSWLQWFDSSGWQGLVGLLITAGGFFVTAINVFRSRKASEAAQKAAEVAVVEVRSLKAIADLTSAIAELDGIRRLLRESSWNQLPERLSYVRKLLIGVGSKTQALDSENATVIREAVAVFSAIEKQIESASRGKLRLNEVKINGLLIDQIDALYELISSLI